MTAIRTLFAAALIPATIWLLLALAGVSVWRAGFLAVNLTTLAAFGLDKHQARSGGSRVPEAVLHSLAAAGGSPCAFLGMAVFRHKTSSVRFQLALYGIAIVQLLLFVGTRF